MDYYQIFAIINNEEITHISRFKSYADANEVAKAIHGDDAFAVNCTQWIVDTEDRYVDGAFYNSNGELAEYIPTQEEEIELLKQTIEPVSTAAMFAALTFTDEQALKVKALYPTWESFIGKSLKKDARVRYEKDLYKVLQDISVVLSNQPPSINTAALYVQIVEDHSGEIDDPIPYNGNMELFKDRYYIQDNVVYRCIRDSGQALYHALKDLVGTYVETI